MILFFIAALWVVVVRCQFERLSDIFRSFMFFPTPTPAPTRAPAPPTSPPPQARWISVASYGTQVRQVNEYNPNQRVRDSSFGRADLPWTNVSSALHIFFFIKKNQKPTNNPSTQHHL
jgi:hypothetical protein